MSGELKQVVVPEHNQDCENCLRNVLNIDNLYHISQENCNNTTKLISVTKGQASFIQSVIDHKTIEKADEASLILEKILFAARALMVLIPVCLGLLLYFLRPVFEHVWHVAPAVK